MPANAETKPKVILIGESMRPSGTTGYARNLLLGLPPAGYDVKLATPEAPPAGLLEKEARARVDPFPGLMGSFSRPFVYRRFLRWAAEREAGLIHGLSAFTAPVCQRLAQELNLPWVLSVHHYQERSTLRVDERCRRVMTCSQALRENLVNDARIPKELIRIVPLGVPVPEHPKIARRDEGRDPVVGTFAKLTPRKDLATFLQAAKEIVKVRLGACQFLVVGDGPEESRLRKLARQLELVKNVTFSHASVPHHQVLADMDVYVQTSRQEGFGTSALEAMAWGVPVVATSVGGLIGLVKDGETGFLVPVGDPVALAGRIFDLLNNAELRAKMGAAAYERAAAEFSLPRMIAGIVSVYTEVLRAQPSATAG